MYLKRALGHLITCKHATRLVSQVQDRPLGRARRILLELHLACCIACMRFERQIRVLRQAMGKYRE